MWYNSNFSQNLERQLVSSVKTLTNQQILARLNSPNRTYYPQEAEEIRRVLGIRGWQICGERGSYSLQATRGDAHDLQDTSVVCYQITVGPQGKMATEQWTA